MRVHDDIQEYAKEAKLPILNEEGTIKHKLYPPLDISLRKAIKPLKHAFRSCFVTILSNISNGG